jgi:acyl-CoA synthetase (AMP-forming)/AMP-acid ligase II
MWRQDDMFQVLDANNRRRLPPEQDLGALSDRVELAGPKGLPVAPLMHGTGLFNAISTLMVGGSITTLPGRRFDPVELLDGIDYHDINSMSIVGDAFAKPILRALDAEPDRWDISSLRVIVSSGVMWSRETKQGLLRHNERLIMVDALGSSEAIGMATNTTTAESTGDTAQFELGPNTRVISEAGRDVTPGSGERGRVALRGFTPIGYYKDPEKSAATFQQVDGVRYSIPGDWAEVLADGTVKLLGRGSQCINTGGEKVYPEEVEMAIKAHPGVYDCRRRRRRRAGRPVRPGDHRDRRAGGGLRDRRRRADRPREGQPCPLQGTQGDPQRHLRRSSRQRQARLPTPHHPRRRHPRRSMSPGGAEH